MINFNQLKQNNNCLQDNLQVDVSLERNFGHMYMTVQFNMKPTDSLLVTTCK